jgi:hypothetical protein
MQNLTCCREIVAFFLTIAVTTAAPSVVEADCVCIQFPYLNLGSYTLYYAHQFEDCPPTACNEFEPIYVAGPPGLEPDECPDGCYSARLANSDKYEPKLPLPVDANWDIHYAGMRKQPKYTLLTEQIAVTPLYYRVYKFKHPTSNDFVRTKVYFMEVTLKNGKKQKPQLIAFGLEVQDDGSDAVLIKSARRHGMIDRYVYEFEIETTKCVVLTSVP